MFDNVKYSSVICTYAIFKIDLYDFDTKEEVEKYDNFISGHYTINKVKNKDYTHEMIITLCEDCYYYSYKKNLDSNYNGTIVLYAYSK